MSTKKPTKYRQAETPQSQAKRGQIVIFVLSLLLIFSLFNNSYHYIDMATSAIRPLIIATCVLLSLLAIGSVLTLWLLTRTPRK